MMKKILIILTTIFSMFIFTACKEDINEIEISFEDIFNEVVIDLATGDSQSNVTTDFSLTTLVFDTYVITWESNNVAIEVIEELAVVTRSNEDVNVELTAFFTFNDVKYDKGFNLTVTLLDEEVPDEPSIDEIKNGITISFNNNDSSNTITSDINLTNSSLSFDVLWESNNSSIKINSSHSLGLVTQTESNVNVTLTAKFKFKDILYTKEFNLTVLKQETATPNTYYQDFNGLVAFRNDNYPEPQSEYLDDYNFILNDINYDVVNFRSDIGMSINLPKVVTIAGLGNDEGIAGRGLIRGKDITDGINSFKFEARLPFSPDSTYPQRDGSDTFTNTTITLSIFKQEQLVYKYSFKFDNNKEANKGKIFEVNDLAIAGTYTFELDISSGHRATVGFIEWDAYKTIIDEPELITSIGFDRLEVDQYHSGLQTLNDLDFNVNNFWSNYRNFHPEKEYPFITAVNEKDISRFKPTWDEAAHIYNMEYFDKVSKIEFMARNFGDYEFSHSGIIKVYYQIKDSDDWILVEESFDLSLEFKTFSVDINQENVRVKIEMSYDQEYEGGIIGSTVNLDNIRYWK